MGYGSPTGAGLLLSLRRCVSSAGRAADSNQRVRGCAFENPAEQGFLFTPGIRRASTDGPVTGLVPECQMTFYTSGRDGPAGLSKRALGSGFWKRLRGERAKSRDPGRPSPELEAERLRSLISFTSCTLRRRTGSPISPPDGCVAMGVPDVGHQPDWTGIASGANSSAPTMSCISSHAKSRYAGRPSHGPIGNPGGSCPDLRGPHRLGIRSAAGDRDRGWGGSTPVSPYGPGGQPCRHLSAA